MKRIDSLTFIRFFAAFIVVIFHFGQDTQLAKEASPFVVSGQQMVSLFFVLSGFVMMVSYYHKENETPGSYYIKRFARIFPVYFAALVIVSIFDFSFDSELNNIQALFLNLTFLQSWFPPYGLSLNYPGWSLSVEAFFYLTFPVSLFLIKKSNISWKKLIFLASLLYLFTQAILSNLLMSEFYKGYFTISHHLIFYFPLTHYCSFLLGIAGGLLYVKHPEWFQKSGWKSLIVFVVTILFTYYIIQEPSMVRRIIRVRPAYQGSFYSLAFLLLVLSFAYSKNIFTNVISAPFFVLLGEASYSIYILQYPFHEIYTKFLFKHLPPIDNPNTDFILFALLLIGVSILSFYFIEKPGKKLILKLYTRAQAYSEK